MRLILLGGLLLGSLSAAAQTIGEVYTFEAIDRQVEGKVYVQFVLGPEGQLLRDSTRVLKGLGYGLDELAVATVHRQSIRPKPSGRAQRYAVPISFSLAALTPRDWSGYYAVKGDRARAAGNAGQAISYYHLALERHKKNSAACAGLAQIYTSQNNAAEAAKYAALASKYAGADR